MTRETRTGGRPATTGVIGGGSALAVGRPVTTTPPGFEWTPLSEIARLETGHTPSRRHPEYWDGEIPWIGIKDATANHGRTIFSTKQWVTPLGIENSAARVLPAQTVCLSRTASIGYVVVMGVPMATSQDFVNWICGTELDFRYLKYVLQLERATLLRFAHGTTHQTIYFPEVKAFHLLLPAITEQRAIADVLGALDDKVESNLRVVNSASELARHYLLSGRERLTVRDVCEVEKGLSYKGSGLISHGGMALANLGNFTTSGWFDQSQLKRYAGDFKSKHLVRPGDLLVANTDLTQRREVLGQPALVPPLAVEMLFTHHVYALRFTEHADLSLAVWAALGTREFRERAKGFATGTTVAALPREALTEFMFTVPAGDALREAKTLLARCWSAEAESQTLERLRDFLLPEMLSGRLKVEPAQELVESRGR